MKDELGRVQARLRRVKFGASKCGGKGVARGVLGA